MNMPSTREADVIAISPSNDGIKNLIKVLIIGPSKIGASLLIAVFTLSCLAHSTLFIT
jgi:hypothetical protein